MLEQGQFNHLIIVLGVPGTGKSTYALGRAVELGKGAYVLAHDPCYRLPETLATGAPAHLRRHETLGQVSDALRNPASANGVHCVPVSDASTVLTMATTIARKGLEASTQSPGQKRKAFPCVALLDEGVMAKGAGLYRLDDQFREVLTQRRHLHIGVIVTYQSANLCHYQLMTMATEIVCFRMHDERDLKSLSRVGFTREECEKIRVLPNYQFLSRKL